MTGAARARSAHGRRGLATGAGKVRGDARMRSPCAGVLAIAVLVALVGTARADAPEGPSSDTVVHRVRAGDTLELIAAELYGDRAKAVFIIVENKLPRARPLKPGERLRIPVSRELTTAPRDTFESLAATYLGSAKRGGFLAEVNGVSPDVSLPAGMALTVPFTIVHTAAASESLADIARTYFGDSKYGELLRRYNFLDRPAIDKLDTLIVPGLLVRVNPAKLPSLDAEARARRDHRRDAIARAARALPAARQAWRDADFAGVKATLAPLQTDLEYLDASDVVAVGVLLGATQLAFDDNEPALATFKRVLDRQPRATLRRYDYSPKVLAIWQKAGGQIE
jgi:LysM repeat protein